jgi:hypothetical protein
VAGNAVAGTGEPAGADHGNVQADDADVFHGSSSALGLNLGRVGRRRVLAPAALIGPCCWLGWLAAGCSAQVSNLLPKPLRNATVGAYHSTAAPARHPVRWRRFILWLGGETVSRAADTHPVRCRMRHPAGWRRSSSARPFEPGRNRSSHRRHCLDRTTKIIPAPSLRARGSESRFSARPWQLSCFLSCLVFPIVYCSAGESHQLWWLHSLPIRLIVPCFS